LLQDYTSLENLTYLKTTYSWSLSPITVSANKKELYKMQTKQDCKVQALPVPMIWSSEDHGERERWGHITSCNKSSAPNKFAVDRILFSFRGPRPQYDGIFVKLLLQHSRKEQGIIDRSEIWIERPFSSQKISPKNFHIPFKHMYEVLNVIK